MRKAYIPLIGPILLGACGNADLSCTSSTTLETVVSCIVSHMPREGSGGFVPPTLRQRADWRTIVGKMLEGSCDFAVPESLDGIVRVRKFTDTYTGRIYCLLMEVRDENGDSLVDKGFGTFIVYNDATRQLSHQAVHPIADATTEHQAVVVFRDTDSRSYLMAGSHRRASSTPSMCLTSAPESDASHNSNTMVQATNEELLAHYGKESWFAIQWHGMDCGTCKSNVHLSHGVSHGRSTDKIAVLSSKVTAHNPDWSVSRPGHTSACNLDATDNMQGRLLNGVPAEAVCSHEASTYTRRFIHIEQDPGEFRDPTKWIAPIVETFP